MPQKLRLTQLPLIGAIFFGLVIGVYLVAGRRFWKRDHAGAVIKHTVDANPDDVLKYWTEDKMRNAKATNMPNVTDLEPGKQNAQRPPHKASPEHS